MKIDTIIFDFGGVLVDWNPRHLYRDYFENEDEMEFFLKNICTDEWNVEQDRGRTLKEATELLQKQFPEYHSLIALFYGEWEKMLKGDIPGTVEILHEVREKFKLYGLTNWSSETIHIAYERFSFFNKFDGILVSGEEKLIKPDPRFYKLLLSRYNLKAENSIFIDDVAKNVLAAKELGIHAIQFKNPIQLRSDLENLGVL
ncbi:HAD family hydrolase [Flavobacterium adhaerens]|uniref:HAD family hydrolase n=1 Tax=Flavobacterium adhaerens TaxID=3149043 RepID=UPI0032B492D0